MTCSYCVLIVLAADVHLFLLIPSLFLCPAVKKVLTHRILEIDLCACAVLAN